MPTLLKSKIFWLVTGLLVICFVPVVAGAVRFHEVTNRAPISEENARFLTAPIPILTHLVVATLYAVLGAFQFIPALRSRKSGWHRRAGRLLAACGLAAGITGLWMTATYTRPEGDGHLVSFFRLVFGVAMVVSIALAIVAVRRRDFAAHGAWMTRAYAIGLGAGTQALTHIPYFLLSERPNELGRGLAMGAGWIINLAVAEWSIRRTTRRRPHAPSGLGSTARA